MRQKIMAPRLLVRTRRRSWTAWLLLFAILTVIVYAFTLLSFGRNQCSPGQVGCPSGDVKPETDNSNSASSPPLVEDTAYRIPIESTIHGGFKPLSIEEFGTRNSKRGPVIPLSADFFTEEKSTSAPSIIFVFPSGDFGLMCNIMHEISAGMDVAMTYPDPTVRVVFALEEPIGRQFLAGFDSDMLVTAARKLSTLDVSFLNISRPLHDMDVVFDWNFLKHQAASLNRGHIVVTLKQARLMRIQRQAFSITLTYLLRPAPEHRKQGETVIGEYRKRRPSEYLLSVHLRNFVWCTPTVKAYPPFCSNFAPLHWSKVRYYEDDCNVTLTPTLLSNVAHEFLGIDSIDRPFSWFLASDLHNLGADQTFYDWSTKNGREVLTIPHMENPEHVITADWGAKRRKGQRLESGGKFLKGLIEEKYDGFNMNWDFSMLVDLHAQTLTDFALGAPWSSCDRILAMWRSIQGKASFSAFMEEMEWNGEQVRQHASTWATRVGGAKRKQTFPNRCYRVFESPEMDEYPLYELVEDWWRRTFMPFVNDPTKTRMEVESQSGTGIDLVLKSPDCKITLKGF